MIYIETTSKSTEKISVRITDDLCRRFYPVRDVNGVVKCTPDQLKSKLDHDHDWEVTIFPIWLMHLKSVQWNPFSEDLDDFIDSIDYDMLIAISDGGLIEHEIWIRDADGMMRLYRMRDDIGEYELNMVYDLE